MLRNTLNPNTSRKRPRSLMLHRDAVVVCPQRATPQSYKICSLRRYIHRYHICNLCQCCFVDIPCSRLSQFTRRTRPLSCIFYSLFCHYLCLGIWATANLCRFMSHRLLLPLCRHPWVCPSPWALEQMIIRHRFVHSPPLRWYDVCFNSRIIVTTWLARHHRTSTNWWIRHFLYVWWSSDW